MPLAIKCSILSFENIALERLVNVDKSKINKNKFGSIKYRAIYLPHNKK